MEHVLPTESSWSTREAAAYATKDQNRGLTGYFQNMYGSHRIVGRMMIRTRTPLLWLPVSSFVQEDPIKNSFQRNHDNR